MALIRDLAVHRARNSDSPLRMAAIGRADLKSLSTRLPGPGRALKCPALHCAHIGGAA
ncbi:hypothetical protein BOFL111202_26560 [Bordetella flabilis]